MSDTPQTDSLARGNHVVPTEFAKDLEREGNQWKRLYEEADWRTVEAEVFKRERDEARSLAEAAYAKADRGEKMLRVAAAKADQYRRAVELIAEDCEAWLNSESDEPSCDFIKLVAKYAREALQ
jgi:hypothetical protein